MESVAKLLSMETARQCADQLRDNCRENMSMIRACRGVKELEGILKGVPIVVAAAGPSLDAAIPVLSLRRPFIIAVDRAARPLLAAGIRPDWIVTIEFDKSGAEKMRGVRGLSMTPLIFHPCAAPETVSEYPGPLYTFNHPDLVTDKGKIALGTGVIIPAVGLAKLMGADPVILVGADCGYPDEGKTHASGVPHIPGDGEAMRFPIPAADGGTVLSNIAMVGLIEELSWFTGGGQYQTSYHGAKIPGWTAKRLEDLV